MIHHTMFSTCDPMREHRVEMCNQYFTYISYNDNDKTLWPRTKIIKIYSNWYMQGNRKLYMYVSQKICLSFSNHKFIFRKDSINKRKYIPKWSFIRMMKLYYDHCKGMKWENVNKSQSRTKVNVEIFGNKIYISTSTNQVIITTKENNTQPFI